jgi:glycosyltransferase involved in cell wall biosynthesis
MLTYNQEQFIAQTIESILMQKTSFQYQLVIGEDASTDRTLEICEKYQKVRPDAVKILRAEKNMGLIRNFMRTLKECDGAFIAICDGDDYWTDPLKLQKQVDFLEQHPDYKIVYTLKTNLLADGSFGKSSQVIMPQTTGFEDLVMDNYIPSVTVLFRNKTLTNSPPEWIVNFPYGDWPLYLWTLVDGGKIWFMDEVTAVYRTEIGASFALRKRLSDEYKVNLQIFKYAIKDPQFTPVKIHLKKGRLHKLEGLMKCYVREGSHLRSLALFLRILIANPSWKPIKMYFYSLKKNRK